jgi:hypothetical protein
MRSAPLPHNMGRNRSEAARTEGRDVAKRSARHGVDPEIRLGRAAQTVFNLKFEARLAAGRRGRPMPAMMTCPEQG